MPSQEYFCVVPIDVAADSFERAYNPIQAGQLAILNAKAIAKLDGNAASHMVMGQIQGVKVYDAETRELLLDSTPTSLLEAQIEMLKAQVQMAQVNSGVIPPVPPKVLAALLNFMLVQKHVGGCSSASCVIKTHVGEHTPGGCTCVSERPQIFRLLRAAKELAEVVSEGHVPGNNGIGVEK